MICPHCKGSRQTGLAFINATSGHRIGRLPCPTCRATGHILHEHQERIEIGNRLREDRRERRLILREEGARLGVGFPEWSRIEAGHFPETEAGETAFARRLQELKLQPPTPTEAQRLTRQELITKHGTLAEFEAACRLAWLNGFVTFEEAQAGIDKYARELAEAPCPSM